MPTVLIVEDDVLIRLNIAEELGDEGFQVVEASNADEAIHIRQQQRDIHLLFTDIDMPGSMDGLKLAAFVRDRWPPVKIIVTSGKHQRPEVPSDVLFVPKPYRPPHLIGLIRSLI